MDDVMRAHMAESIRRSQRESSAVCSEWQRAHLNKGEDKAEGWSMVGISTDEKVTDIQLSVAKINKGTPHWFVCAPLTLKEPLMWFSYNLPLFLSPLLYLYCNPLFHQVSSNLP